MPTLPFSHVNTVSSSLIFRSISLGSSIANIDGAAALGFAAAGLSID